MMPSDVFLDCGHNFVYDFDVDTILHRNSYEEIIYSYWNTMGKETSILCYELCVCLFVLSLSDFNEAFVKTHLADIPSISF